MKALFLKLFALFTGLSTQVWTFIEPVLKDEAGKLLQVALPLAFDIVKGLATKDISKTQKKDEAVQQLKTVLIKEGFTVGTNIANIAIETAVAKLKINK